MTRAEFISKFPNASEDTVRANCHEYRKLIIPEVAVTTCAECATPFIPKDHNQGPDYRQIFCTQKCAASHTGKKTMRINRRVGPQIGTVSLICETCKKEFGRYASTIEANKRRGIIHVFCSNECAAPHTSKTGSETQHAKGLYAAERNYSRCSKGWVAIGDKRFFARSSWEANYGRYLQWSKERGMISDWEHEPETFWFPDIKRGTRSYLPDFKVTNLDGKIVFHEVKGWMDDKSKTKIKRMAKYHPEVQLNVVDASAYRALANTMKTIVPGWTTSRNSR